MSDYRDEVTGVILAGGRAKRMSGEDKGLIELCGRPMVEHVLELLRPQVHRTVISANRNLAAYRAYGCEVVTDVAGHYAGPLAGMVSGMQTASTPYVVSVPCDSPLIADDLVSRLHRTLRKHGAEASVAHDGERVHPVFLLLKRDLVDSMLGFLAAGERKIDLWFEHHHVVETDFSDRPTAFMNVNRPEDLDILMQILAQRSR